MRQLCEAPWLCLFGRDEGRTGTGSAKDESALASKWACAIQGLEAKRWRARCPETTLLMAPVSGLMRFLAHVLRLWSSSDLTIFARYRVRQVGVDEKEGRGGRRS
jgi:hypothetical protein